MAKREVLGTMDCPECGKSGAEVKEQKNGMAYRWCPECNAQYFTRTPETDARLRAKIGGAKPVTVSLQEPEAKTAPMPAPKPKAAAPAPMPAPIPKPKGTGNAFLDLIQGAT